MGENEHLKFKVQDLKDELEFITNENKVFVEVNAEEIESLKSENKSLKTQLEDSSRTLQDRQNELKKLEEEHHFMQLRVEGLEIFYVELEDEKNKLTEILTEKVQEEEKASERQSYKILKISFIIEKRRLFQSFFDILKTLY